MITWNKNIFTISNATNYNIWNENYYMEIVN